MRGKKGERGESRNRVESHPTADVDVPVKSQNIRLWTWESERTGDTHPGEGSPRIRGDGG